MSPNCLLVPYIKVPVSIPAFPGSHLFIEITYNLIVECNNGLQVRGSARLDIKPVFCLKRLELDGLYVNDSVGLWIAIHGHTLIIYISID